MLLVLTDVHVPALNPVRSHHISDLPRTRTGTMNTLSNSVQHNADDLKIIVGI